MIRARGAPDEDNNILILYILKGQCPEDIYV